MTAPGDGRAFAMRRLGIEIAVRSWVGGVPVEELPKVMKDAALYTAFLILDADTEDRKAALELAYQFTDDAEERVLIARKLLAFWKTGVAQ